MRKLKQIQLNRGMTYVELIVVLSIFAVMTSIILFNYGSFQANIDIKNLASDIALKIVEAQKASLSGQLPPANQYDFIADPKTSWKPSYGVYFNSSTDPDMNNNDNPFNKEFIYFTDVDGTPGYSPGSEGLDTIDITKSYSISRIDECNESPCGVDHQIQVPLSITFKRPSSGASFYLDEGVVLDPKAEGFKYIQITIESPSETKSLIKIYPSGRIQVN